MKRILSVLLAFSAINLLLLSSVSRGDAAESILAASASADTFPLVGPAGAVPLWFDRNDATVVGIAANDLAADIERVTGTMPALHVPGEMGVIIGTLGHSALVDDLVRAGKLDPTLLAGKWETFLITTVERPKAGVERALVIAGSDRRGTAFGVYELSQQIGVSPWNWWADVPATRRSELHLRAGATVMGPPSVKYRGIFINDEDWGLHPWAVKTFDPEFGDIGPKTYRKVFELMLRLKANTVWPAMHEVTKAFNLYPENKQVADDYAIVMGSSHAEPMLRNNVTEWTAPAGDFNYVANRDGVRAYWESRVVENGRFENIYTLGMRGIHDSGMVGAGSVADQVAALEAIFADQRALLARHVSPRAETVPQVFTPYKEVLGIYRAGLKVPDDVTIVWPDDNHGYIRYFPAAEERERAGGFGVYYHLSYLGAPMAYLWLATTPPALIWQEMAKAYEHGARTLWIANVGDIKPAEIGIELFLQMAWNIERWGPDAQPAFLRDWATREFGDDHATEIAAVMSGFYQLNFQRRPEHLQWWLPHTRVRGSPLTPSEKEARLAAFADLTARVARLREALVPASRDAFFQLVEYPVRGATLANVRYFGAEEYTRLFNADPAAAQGHGARARAADTELAAITREFNETIADGKWRHFMAVEPADGIWRSYRAMPPILPAANMVAGATEAELTAPVAAPVPVPEADGSFRESGGTVFIEAEHFTRSVRAGGAAWQVIPGLGRTGSGSVAILPTTSASIAVEAAAAPRLEYEIAFATPGERTMTVNLIPTHPLVADRGLRFAVGLGDQTPALVVAEVRDGSPEWAQGVLAGTVTTSAQVNVPAAGTHVLKVYMIDAGVVVDRLVLETISATSP